MATTNRKRYLEKNSTNDFKFIKRKIIVNKKTAILFGPENSGLSNEDLRLSDIIFTIETSSKSNSFCVFIANSMWQFERTHQHINISSQCYEVYVE